MNSIFLTVFLSFVCVSLGSNILVFHNLGTRSHLNIVYPIIRQLLDNGDQVHSMIYSPAGFLHENYTELLLEDHYGLMMERVSQEYGSGGRTFLDPSHLLYMLTEWSNIIYEGTKALDTPQFKKLSNSTFDLVLSFNPWGFYLGELFDCPVVVFSPPGAFPSHTQLIGNPFNPSYQPVITSDLSDPTRFLSRVKNYLMYHVMDLIFRRFADTAITYSMRNQIGYEGPSMFQLAEKRLALVLSNSNFITHTPQPLLPNVVEVGGVHIKDVVEDLPEDIQKFLDAATDGVVYVSFGSAIRTNRIPEKKVQILLDSFKAVGVPVLLKWDTNITTTNNIMVKQWLPQQAVLQHPNVKVFLTHGGLMSVMESLHTKTVMVGVPMATDQFANIARAVNNNIAKHVSWETLTAYQLTQAMKSALTDKNMQRSIRKLGDLFGDAPESALQRAVWWINYVIRHNGAKFLRSESLRLDWYQVYLLDVMFVLLILPAISINSLGRWLLELATTYKEKQD